ncbi:DUF1501 domain-containing protein [Thalassoglobus polymorphus]|uniref:Sulfatase n=1 Tax=Thalassoglobus polymorphus TaxID=2527994 RepID=A0A517QKR6_9PLAN|nr:DUF1501 domain-containing protein [Thalassoglobus polymorphus]QDT32239.1 hypothetical protein Mal48_14820 [Thalassoglobus polymorphus]
METHRRQFLKGTVASAMASTLVGAGVGSSKTWASDTSHTLQMPPLGKAEHCIVLWLGGGASQIDTWDPKRQSKDGLKDPGSSYASIPTAIPGAKVCEHLSRTAPLLDRAALLRTVHHDVINEHSAAVNRMHTGRPISGTVEYPALGSVVSHLKGPAGDAVPKYVLMGYPTPSRSPGFLGAAEGYLYLTETTSGPKGLIRPERISQKSYDRRRQLLDRLRAEATVENRPKLQQYDELLSQGFRLSGPEFMQVFDLDNEPADLRNSYGDEFGQRCLLARRLVERGVRFVEVTSNLNFVNGTGWDTHNDGHKKQHLLIQSLDAALSSLLLDLETHHLLDKTMVVVYSEFGRPGRYDSGGGRNHHSKAFSTVIAGGGLNTGQVIGETDDLAENPLSRPISVPDFFATIYQTLGIPQSTELDASSRPIPLTDGGRPLHELFT